jgi:Ca2+-transporting ATPase
MFFAALMGMPIPLLPLQILWVNLVTDGLPAMALGVDKKAPDIMNRPPRHPRESVFSRGLSRKIILKGIQIGISTLLVFSVIYYLKNDLDLARTAAFATLVFCQLFHVFECRSETHSVFELNFLSNKFLLVAVGTSLGLQLSIMYIPFFSSIFSTVPLSFTEWALVILVSGCTFMLSGLKYLLFERRRPAGKAVFVQAK